MRTQLPTFLNSPQANFIIFFVFCAWLGLTTATIAYAQVGEEIASAYGVSHFEDIEVLEYTFNAKVGDKLVKRSWRWRPKNKTVDYLGSDGQKLHLDLNKELSSEEQRSVHAWFINDSYWLLFPFHLRWDEFVKIQEQAKKAVPPGGDAASRHVLVTYTGENGYTPGDVYELFLDDSSRIRHWIYRKGGSKTPTRSSTWENNKKFGDLILSLEHKDPESDFRVWFSDVDVKFD